MGNFYMESTQINYRRDEKTKTVDQKLQELSETSAIDTDIAPVFKSTNTYQAGDMVYYRNKLYVFNVEHTGTWAAADVTATDVTTEISSLKSGLTNQGGNITPVTNVTNDTADYSIISRMGNVVTVFVSLVISESISAWNKLADLSAGFRPIHTTMTVGWIAATSEPCLVRIGNDGSIMISKAVSTGKVQFSASYIVN